MQGLSDVSPRVSVIIPVYNCEDYLHRCLDSVFGQTMQSFEVIAVNDGSTDSSLQILREYETKHPNLRVIDQANAGQGAARNHALELAQGEYILFVDSDDFIESVTLQVTTERADRDQSDLVHFDWKFASSDPQRPDQYHYYNVESFWHHRVLEGADCELLFRMHSYFSVVNLYRRGFLNQHRIRFEEGQIYEDNPFLAKVFTRADLVSLVHSPLYIIQANPESSTKRGADTDRHMRDHLAAVQKSFEAAEPRRTETLGDLAEYHLEKFAIYYERRVPKRLRSEYAREFVEILGGQDLHFDWLGRSSSWLTRVCLKTGVFTHGRTEVLRRAIEVKTLITPAAKKALGVARKAKRRALNPKQTLATMRAGRRPALDRGTILFLGFDGRYTGNSRALFDEIINDARYSGFRILYVTDDTRVPKERRVSSNGNHLSGLVRSAELVIAESWIPHSFVKHPDSTWLQLWHGTPIKRMLFDSHEPEITRARPRHKINKYRDIQRWDHLVVDSELAESKFETAFLFPPAKMVRAQYPRVGRLIRDAGIGKARHTLRKELGITADMKVVLYAPTWRDYNYGLSRDDRDHSYQVNVESLAQALGDGYVVLLKDHHYLPVEHKRGPQVKTGYVDANGFDIHNLLLISDCVVSDYSSLIFDARAIGIPVVRFTSDEEQFSRSRGTYEDVVSSLEAAISDSATEVVTLVRRLAVDRSQIPPISGAQASSVSDAILGILR